MVWFHPTPFILASLPVSCPPKAYCKILLQPDDAPLKFRGSKQDLTSIGSFLDRSCSDQIWKIGSFSDRFRKIIEIGSTSDRVLDRFRMPGFPWSFGALWPEPSYDTSHLPTSTLVSTARVLWRQCEPHLPHKPPRCCDISFVDFHISLILLFELETKGVAVQNPKHVLHVIHLYDPCANFPDTYKHMLSLFVWITWHVSLWSQDLLVKHMNSIA